MERNITTRMFTERNVLVKLTVTVLCLVCLMFHIGFYAGCPWWNHFAYSFCHANIFHLAINLLVLWGIKNQIPVAKSFIIAVVASFLPMYVSDSTMGLSGFLFAAFGILWGKTGRWIDAAKKALPFILCTMIVPNVNGLLHLWCFILGYIFECFIVYIRRRCRA